MEKNYRKKLPHTPIIRTTIHLQKIVSSTRPSQVSTTTPDAAANNEFLYFNNVTQKFEGISVQSTYSILRLTPSVNLTIITTTPEIVPLTTEVRKTPPPPLPPKTSQAMRHSNPLFQSRPTTPVLTTTKAIATSPILQAPRNFLPLYHQFIYTVKLPNQVLFVNNKNILDLLYEQNMASSRLRVSLMRAITEQLGFNLTSLRLNWIEIVNSKFIESMSMSDESGDMKTTTPANSTRPIHMINLD
jgi:hypothetical protein